MTQTTPPPRTQHGFTLVEMAIGVLVIALLLGSILVPLSTQVEQRKVSETEKALDEIREALIGFALSQGHLPCPDLTTSNDGVEDVDVATGQCIPPDPAKPEDIEGNLPWATLSVVGADSWGNRFRYRVLPEFARRSPATLFSLETSAANNTHPQVCPTSACASFLTTNTEKDSPPAVVVSHGRNGLGAISSLSNNANPAPSSADELENADGDRVFVSRVATAAGSTAGEFDDLVIWISRPILFNRMVAAGKLPRS